MQFEPTNNYYGLDLSQETNRILYNFWEFVKNLVTLSCDSEKQIEIMGYGAVIDEMAIDYESYYTLFKQTYLREQLITLEQKQILDDIDEFIEQQSGDLNPDFWDDFKLNSNPEWKILRKKAKNALELLNYENLEILIERTEEFNNNGKLELQLTQTKLIRITPANKPS